jgi:hypothetical protein
VPIETKPGFSPGTPRLVFEGSFFVSYHYYDVMPDGKHFIFIKQAEQARSAMQINVVLNWLEELSKRPPQRNGSLPDRYRLLLPILRHLTGCWQSTWPCSSKWLLDRG